MYYSIKNMIRYYLLQVYNTKLNIYEIIKEEFM